MAGDKEEKKKKSKSDSDKAERKEKKDKKDKSDRKDKKEKSTDSSKDKKSTGDVLIDRKMGLDRKQNGAAPAPRPQPRRPPATASQDNGSSYLGDFDLPSSDDEDSDEEIHKRKTVEDDSQNILMARVCT